MTQPFLTSRYLTHSMAIAMLLASAFSVGFAPIAAAKLPPDWQERIKLSVYAYATGDNRWALDRTSKLVQDGESQFGSSDGRMARLYTNLGEVLSQQNRMDYALQYLKRGLNVAEKGYGENSLETVPALIDLAQLYVHQQNYSQALPLFKRALGIVDKPGDDDLLTYAAVVETDLGSMYFAEGKPEFSEPHFMRAVSLANRSLGPNHKWTTTIEAMYAASLKQLGKKKEAKAIERAAVAKANEIQSPIFIWNKKIALADEAMANKHFSDAEAALKKALEAAQKLTDEPMLQVVTLTKYGQLFLMQDQTVLAIAKLKQAQALADATLGLEDKSVLEHAKQLADLERTKGQYPDAAPLYRRLAAHAKTQFGPESEEYANALASLASLYNTWGEYPKATSTYTKVLALLEKLFGPESAKLIPILLELGKEQAGRTYLNTDKKPEEYLKRAEKIATDKFGKDSKELVRVLGSLGIYYQKRIDWVKAVKTYKQIIAADEKIFGPESPETLKALEQYADCLQMAGYKKEAALVEARIAKIKNPKTDD